MLDERKVVILTNIISPYKTLLFNELCKICKKMTVLYIAKTSDIREWNIKEEELKFPHEILSARNLERVSIFGSFARMWGKLNAVNPDILIIDGYSHSASWAAFFWTKSNGKKLILWSSSNQDDRRRTFIKELTKGFLIKRCDAANTYGSKSKKYLLELGARQEDKILLMGNTTDNNFYFTETARLKINRAALCQQMAVPFHNFLYIGRFSLEKNILQVVEAYARLHTEKWGIILLGDGPQMNDVKAYVETHSVKNVFMPGWKQKDQIPKYFAVSDVFILPSVSETWGLVVNEAMAAGLPVLVSKKCGCFPDLIKEGFNGFSFDPFDAEELFNLMREMAHGKIDLKMLGRNSLKIIKNYTPEKAAKIVMETIELVYRQK